MPSMYGPETRFRDRMAVSLASVYIMEHKDLKINYQVGHI